MPKACRANPSCKYDKTIKACVASDNRDRRLDGSLDFAAASATIPANEGSDARAVAHTDRGLVERFSENLVDHVLAYAPVAAGNDMNLISQISILKCSNLKWTSTAITEGYSEIRVRLFVGYDGDVSYQNLVDAVALVEGQVAESTNSSTRVFASVTDPDGWLVDLELEAFVPDPEYVVAAVESTKPDTLIEGIDAYASYAVVAACCVAGLLLFIVVYRYRTREIIYYLDDAENDAAYKAGDQWGASFPPWDDHEEEDVFQISMLAGRHSSDDEECGCELCVKQPSGSPQRARVREVLLQRKSQHVSFGFTLGSSKADDESGLTSHVVTSVKPNGCADGQLVRGNVVHTINGQGITPLTHEAIATMIVASKFSIALGIDSQEVELQSTTPPLLSDLGGEVSQLAYVTLTRGGLDESFGFSLGYCTGSEPGSAVPADDDVSPHMIVKVFPNSPAYGVIGVGDVIHTVNGQPIVEQPHHEVIAMVRSSGTSIALGVGQERAAVNVSFVSEFALDDEGEAHPTYTGIGDPILQSEPTSPLPPMPTSPEVGQTAPLLSTRTSSSSMLERRAKSTAVAIAPHPKSEVITHEANGEDSDDSDAPPPPVSPPSNFSPLLGASLGARTPPELDTETHSPNSSPTQRRTKLKEKIARRRAADGNANYVSPARSPSPKKSAIKERIAQRMKAQRVAASERSSSVEVDEYVEIGSPASVGSSLPPSPVKMVTNPTSSYSPRRAELGIKSPGAAIVPVPDPAASPDSDSSLSEDYKRQWRQLSDVQVTVARSPGMPLGLAFQGGRVEGKPDIPALKVTKVKVGSVCDGLLQTGDLIRSINGTYVNGMTHDQCVALIVEAPPGDLHFHVKRKAEAAASTSDYPLPSEPARAPPPPPPPAAKKPSMNSDFSHGFDVPTLSSDGDAEDTVQDAVLPKRKLSRFQGGGFLEDSYTEDVMEEGIAHPQVMGEASLSSFGLGLNAAGNGDRARSDTLARDAL